MSFSTIKLANDRVVVRGTDIHGTSGETIVNGAQWAEVGARTEFKQATEAFDQAVEDFFAPLTQAIEAVESKVAKPSDSIGYVVFEEAEEGRPHKPGQLIKLTRDSVVLRLIEQGNTDRLIWVNGELEVTEDSAVSTSASSTAAAGQPDVATDVEG